jgi:phenol hydroxylase P1 protein
MADHDDLVDPRQYYYGAWTQQRARQQDSQERTFELVETHGLLERLDPDAVARIRDVVIPVRHAAWAANANNCYIAAYGFGAPITSACSLHMMDHLGIAQYVSRIGLVLDRNGTTVLEAARVAWLHDPTWQPLRALAEASMVTRDWFELFVLQNLLVDGTLHPLIFDRLGRELIAGGGVAFALLSQFMREWYVESSRWVDAAIQRAATESAGNRALIAGWIETWLPRVEAALDPIAGRAFGGRGRAILDEVRSELVARAAKAGVVDGQSDA